MGLLQQIAVKAYHFAKCCRSSVSLNAASSSPEFDELRRLIDGVTLRDCNLDPDRALFSYSFYEHESNEAPCFAMQIYEDEFLHMSIFGCRSPNGYIPLHDHKGMHGFLKVLYGQGRLQTFSRTDRVKLPQNSSLDRLFKQRLSNWQEKTVFPTLAGQPNFQVDPKSPCCVLTPEIDNLHFVQPVHNRDLIFFDLLTPPYLPGRRDCHYFEILEPIGDEPTAVGGNFLTKLFAKNDAQNFKLPTQKLDGRDVVWLARRPPPEDYFCQELPYQGEKIDLDEEIYAN